MSIVLLRAVTYDLQSGRDWVGYQPSPIFFKFRFMKHYLILIVLRAS